MLRFLRRYNKWILVIGGILLMIAFTAPQAIKSISGNPLKRKAAVMHVSGRTVKVTEEQLLRSAKELAALDRFAPGLIPAMLGIESNANREHWFLLSRAARRGGFVAGQGDGETWIPEIAQAIVQIGYYRQYGSSAGIMMQIQAKQVQQQTDMIQTTLETNFHNPNIWQGLTEEQFGQALSTARGISRMIDAYRRATRFSDRRAVEQAKRTLDTVVADYVFIPAQRFAGEIPDPDPAQLEAHFQQFKNTRPDEGEFGIGYLLPPRVKISWLTLDRSAIRSAIRLDAIEVDKFVRRNRDRYPPDGKDNEQRARDEITDLVLDEVLLEADRAIRTEVMKATRHLEQTEDGLIALPDDWAQRRPRFDAIADVVVAHVQASMRGDRRLDDPDRGVLIPRPRVEVREAGWLTRDEVSALPGIGPGRIRLGSISYPFASAAFMPLGSGADNPLRVQIGLPFTSQPVTDGSGNRYYFTVLAAVDESPPASLEEIHDRAVRDYKALQAYQALTDRADDYAEVAKGGGLTALVDSLNAESPEEQGSADAVDRPQVSVVKGARITRLIIQPADPLVNAEPLLDGVVEAAMRLDPTVDPAQLDEAERVVALPAPVHLGLAVFRIDRIEPLTRERLRLFADRVVGQASAGEFSDAIASSGKANPFSFENLKKRFEFSTVREKRDAPTVEAGTDQETDQDTG